MSRSSGVPEAEHRAELLADGTELKYTIRTDDPAVYHLFTADLSRRLRSAQVHVPASGSDRSFARFRSFAPGADRSSATYELPRGEVAVSIDAGGPAVHGYLRYHVESAIAYTRALDVAVSRASAVAAAFLGQAMLLLVAGQPFLAAPAFGAWAAIVAPLGLNRLAARDRPISVSRWDVPVRR